MALGLHSSQALPCSVLEYNRLRVTFWTIYYMERITCLFLGRPTCLVDDYIDVPHPEDTPGRPGTDPIGEYAYIRAMTVVGKISHDLMMASYSPKTVKTALDLPTMNRLTDLCIAELQQVCDSLPQYLRFFEKCGPVGHEWQEVQRTSLGITYHLVRLLIFRPSLVYATFFTSLAAAQESIGNQMVLKINIDNCISSAKMIIDLAHDSFFNRCPNLCQDGHLASAVITACLTLLFDVLDAQTTLLHANEVFGFVDRSLECLCKVDHIGSTTGRAMSMEVMRTAKEALYANELEASLLRDLSHNFTWLNHTTSLDQAGQTDQNASPWTYSMLGIPGFDQSDQLQLATGAISRATNPENLHQAITGIMGEGLCFLENYYGA